MDHFLTIREVERITSLKKSKIYDLIRAGEFPAQHAVTARRRAWLASEVTAWIATKLTADCINEQVGEVRT